MKQKSKKILLASLISAGLLAGGAVAGVKMHKNAQRRAVEKEKREALAQKLQQENDSLAIQQKQYDARRLFYTTSAKEHAVKHPDCDDMKKLYALADKMDSVVASKYNTLEANFISKCKIALKKYELKGGKYHIAGDGGGDYIEPVNSYDWMGLLYEHSGNIPNFAALEKEYERLNRLEDLIWEYEEFLGGRFYVYVDNGNARTHNKKSTTMVVDEEEIDVGGGYSLDSRTYRYVNNDVLKYNDLDNVEQEDIINELFQKYLYPFIVYGENGMQVMDNALFNEIRRLALRIQHQNELESGKISYEQAISDVNKQIRENQANITALQQTVR